MATEPIVIRTSAPGAERTRGRLRAVRNEVTAVGGATRGIFSSFVGGALLGGLFGGALLGIVASGGQASNSMVRLSSVLEGLLEPIFRVIDGFLDWFESLSTLQQGLLITGGILLWLGRTAIATTALSLLKFTGFVYRHIRSLILVSLAARGARTAWLLLPVVLRDITRALFAAIGAAGVWGAIILAIAALLYLAYTRSGQFRQATSDLSTLIANEAIGTWNDWAREINTTYDAMRPFGSYIKDTFNATIGESIQYVKELIGVLDALRQYLGIPGIGDVLPFLTQTADASAQPVPGSTGPLPIIQPVRIPAPDPTNDLFRQQGDSLLGLTPFERNLLGGLNPFGGAGDNQPIRGLIQPITPGTSFSGGNGLVPSVTPQDFGQQLNPLQPLVPQDFGQPQPTLGGRGTQPPVINQYIYRTDVTPETVQAAQDSNTRGRANGGP